MMIKYNLKKHLISIYKIWQSMMKKDIKPCLYKFLKQAKISEKLVREVWKRKVG